MEKGGTDIDEIQSSPDDIAETNWNIISAR